MNETIQSILGDLYALDPDLKKSEKDLIPLLEKLAESKPSLDLDENFVTNLKNQLMVRADELMEKGKPAEALAKAGWFSRFLAPLMGGTVALAALAIGLMVWNGQIGVGPKPEVLPTVAPMATRNLMAPKDEESAAEAPPTPMAKQAPANTQAQDNSAQKEAKAPAPSAAPAPMMLQALPAEGEAESATPPPVPKASLRTTDMAAAGVSNVGVDPVAYALSALKRAQTGEQKITADSAQIGFRSPQELINLNFDNLPEEFGEIANALPAGYRAFVDQAGPTPEYYIYFEKTFQWYGPF